MKHRSFRLRAISLGLLFAFGSIQPVQANIVADSSAAAGLRPEVTETSAGTPQVNIQAPSAAGVSRNVYREFNVDGRGVILNNSYVDTNTVIGGNVTGNAALANGQASIILNEVNSNSPSQLNGFIEVAGQRAEVVIANPSGISCSGCGFINASRGVLTTGQAMVENGVLTGYNVDRGEVTIDGDGFYGADEYSDIIARSVKINSRVNAAALGITTGRNVVDAQNTTVTKLTDSSDSKPELALDVTSLGSIYAGKIRMIGTEKGVGVNLAGNIESFDNLEITADGEINNSAGLRAHGDIQLAGQTVRNSSFLSGNNISIDSNTMVNANGAIYGQNVTIKSDIVDNQRGFISGADTSITASSVNNEAGGLEGYNQLVVQAENLNNKDGMIMGGNNLTLDIKDGIDSQGTIWGAETTIQPDDNGVIPENLPDEPIAPEDDNQTPVPDEPIAPEDDNQPPVLDEPATPEDGNPIPLPEEPEGEKIQPDEHGVIGVNDDGIPVRDIGSIKDSFDTWKSHSGFNAALAELLKDSTVDTSAVWQNDDIMAYLYLTYASGTEMTPEILKAVSNQVFGLRPASESAQNIEQVRLIADLIGNCVAGNCKTPEEPAIPETPEMPSDDTTPPNENNVPNRDVGGSVKDEFYAWQSGSGFFKALANLSGSSKKSAILKNEDVMAYLYLTYASGTEMTPEILQAVTNEVFGLRPASESAQNLEQVRVIANLMESCMAGNCL